MRFRTSIKFFLFISTCTGLCFSDDNVFISMAGDCRYPTIANEGSCMYMGWLVAEGNIASLYFRRSDDEGNAWTSAKKISGEKGDCYPPAIAVDSGIVHLVWIDYGETIDGEIYYARSADQGNTWEKNYVLIKDANSARYPLLACKGRDVYIIWQDVENKVYFKASHNRGRTWETEKLLGKVGKHSCYCFPPAISAQGKELSVVWTDFREDKKGINASLYGVTVFKNNKKNMSSVICRMSLDSGRTWSKERILTSTTFSKDIKDEIDNPTMLSDGTLSYLFWLDRRNIQLGEIFYARFNLMSHKGMINGKNIYPMEKRSPKRPTAVFDRDGNIHFTWASFFQGESIINYGEIDPAGNILQDKKILTPKRGRYHNPLITRTQSGTLYIFWFDEPKDKDEWSKIFSLTSRDNGKTWEAWEPTQKD
jgi:hypothetical protein